MSKYVDSSCNSGGIYCLYVAPNKETHVEKILRAQDFNVIEALTERKVYKAGVWKRVWRPLMPGYVFFEAETEPDFSDVFFNLTCIFYPLQYADGEHALRGRDAEFMRNIKLQKDIFKISPVYAEGTKIKAIKGSALEGLEGSIVKVNRKKGWVIVRPEGCSMISSIKVGIEFLENA